MWSMDYVQVPIDDDPSSLTAIEPIRSPANKNTASSQSDQSEPRPATHRPTPSALHGRLVKQIHVSSSGEGAAGLLVKSGSESSLSEDSSRHTAASASDRPLEGSPKEWRSEQQDEKEVCSDNEESCVVKDQIEPVVRRRRSRVNTVFRKSEGGSSADGGTLEICSFDDNSNSSLRTSKSDTSLTDSFVVVPDTRKRPINPQSVLRSGKIIKKYE